MNLLLDTNILLYIARDNTGHKVLQYINPEKKAIYISYANVAEIESLAFQNNWSAARLERLESFISAVRVIEMSDTFIRSYVEIDAFSQKKHPTVSEYPFSTPRNMGKHDLWIAATASLLDLKLVTTDNDFDHLSDSFVSLEKLDGKELRSQ